MVRTFISVSQLQLRVQIIMFTESFSYAEIIYLLYCYEKWRGRISRKYPIYLEWAHKGNTKPKTFYVVSDNAISLFSLSVSFPTFTSIVFIWTVCVHDNKTSSNSKLL